MVGSEIRAVRLLNASISARYPSFVENLRLTSAEEDYIKSYDNTLAIANVSKFFGKR
jgi:hypothetical protein